MSAEDMAYGTLEQTIVYTLEGIDIICYVALLGFALFNTVKFLILGGRGNVFLVLVFYLLTILICLLRITYSIERILFIVHE